RKENTTEMQVRFSIRLKWLAIVIVMGAVLVNEVGIARVISADGLLDPGTISTVRKVQVRLIVGGALLLILKGRIAAGLNWLQRDRASRDDSHFAEAGTFVISLIVPLIILLNLIEDNGTGLGRLWWLWPVEVVILASVATYWPSRLRAPRFWIWIGSSVNDRLRSH